MRYELNDGEWAAIKPMLPNKPRGVPRVNDRRVLNGIFWVLRSGAPWRDLPDNFGPYTTCYSRFVRWRGAGVWAKIMSALAGAHDAAVQMIDTLLSACISTTRASLGIENSPWDGREPAGPARTDGRARRPGRCAIPSPSLGLINSSHKYSGDRRARSLALVQYLVHVRHM